MSITTQTKISNIIKERDDAKRQAERVLSDMNVVLGRTSQYLAYMHDSHLNNEGIFDQQEVDAYQVKMAQMVGAIQALVPLAEAMVAIQGADDAATRTNLDAFITANSIDLTSYSEQFE